MFILSYLIVVISEEQVNSMKAKMSLSISVDKTAFLCLESGVGALSSPGILAALEGDGLRSIDALGVSELRTG